jgi:hypothetical protein
MFPYTDEMLARYTRSGRLFAAEFTIPFSPLHGAMQQFTPHTLIRELLRREQPSKTISIG